MTVGFVTGILRVGFSDTVPVPVDTVPIAGTHQYRTVNDTVSYKTCGTTGTHGFVLPPPCFLP